MKRYIILFFLSLFFLFECYAQSNNFNGIRKVKKIDSISFYGNKDVVTVNDTFKQTNYTVTEFIPIKVNRNGNKTSARERKNTLDISVNEIKVEDVIKNDEIKDKK